jgi:hypothetical protein
LHSITVKSLHIPVVVNFGLTRIHLVPSGQNMKSANISKVRNRLIFGQPPLALPQVPHQTTQDFCRDNYLRILISSGFR